VEVVRRSGDHLLSVIEGTMDIARIESGKLTLDMRPLDFTAFMRQLVAMFSLQAQQKGWISALFRKANCRRWCGPMKSGCGKS
jgi:signal transduction histidine kinase